MVEVKSNWKVDTEDKSIVICPYCGIDMFRPVDRYGGDIGLNFCPSCGRCMIEIVENNNQKE